LRGALAGLEIDRLLAEHVNEHRVMRARLSFSSETAMLREAIDSMRAHLDVEEHQLGAVAQPAVLPTRA
jgi:hypothetical protein